MIKRSLSIFTLLCLSLILIGFLYLFIPKGASAPFIMPGDQTSPTITSQPRPTPAPAPIPVKPAPKPTPQASNIPTDWKTYRNEEYGFEISYPAEYEVEYYQGITPDNFSIHKKKFDEGVFIGVNAQSPKEFPSGLEEPGGHPIKYTTKQEKLSFGDVAAIKHTIRADSYPFYISISEFQGIRNPKWGKDGEIFYMGIQSDHAQETIKINDQIVSTLRFLP